MWNRFWYSLGRAARFAAKSTEGTPARGKSIGRILRGTIQAGSALALPGLAASAALRKRAILILSVVPISFNVLARMLLGRRGPPLSIKAVKEQAEGIARVLRDRDIAVNKLGIDGLPGSGKSALARALAESLNMEWRSLDYRNLGLPGNLKQRRVIYEHHRLFRTHDVDAFDVIVYIDEPAERSRAKVRRRGRGRILAAVLDYDKLKKIGKLAFYVCGGEAVVIPNSDLVLKIKPPGGFHVAENIASRLGAARLPSTGQDLSRAGPGRLSSWLNRPASGKLGPGARRGELAAGPQTEPAEGGLPRSPGPSGRGAPESAGFDTSGMSREEMLFLLAYGERQSGLSAYFLPPSYVAFKLLGKGLAGLRAHLFPLACAALIGRLTAGLYSAGRRFVVILCANDPAVRRARGGLRE